MIIEKVAFQSISSFEKIINLLSKNKIKAWINCPRRLEKTYIKIKKILVEEKKINIKVVGNNWGLASNSVHMLDLFAFLTNQNKFIISNKKFHNKIYKSKRESFKLVFLYKIRLTI